MTAKMGQKMRNEFEADMEFVCQYVPVLVSLVPNKLYCRQPCTPFFPLVLILICGGGEQPGKDLLAAYAVMN